MIAHNLLLIIKEDRTFLKTIMYSFDFNHAERVTQKMIQRKNTEQFPG